MAAPKVAEAQWVRHAREIVGLRCEIERLRGLQAENEELTDQNNYLRMLLKKWIKLGPSREDRLALRHETQETLDG